jgi:pimeloyl-ACP methyl ester carboxylesterase
MPGIVATMATTPPPIRYAQSGDVDIAYQVLGEGPPDLVFVMGFLTHLRAYWEDPSYRRFCERLASFSRLILFDKRGMGLSDRVRIATLEERMDDVRAVMDSVGSERAALIGISEGAPLSILFAATHPRRTHALVLCGAEVKEETTEEWPWGEDTREDFEQSMARVAEVWPTTGEGIWRRLPSRGNDERLREWWKSVVSEAASPRAAEAFMRMAFEIDVRNVVESINVPTLVVHAAGDEVCHVENGRWLAAHIAGARYIELPGGDHLPWGEHADTIAAEIEELLTGRRAAPVPDTVLATVLFTDVVESTERAAELGDRRWRELLELHHVRIRRELDRFRGREIDTAGDGFLASFDGPARAIRCASAALESVRELGLELRAGIHTGECELLDGKLGGIAVHIGARVAALAEPGEVLVSQTVRDLIAGSGISLDDRGIAQLKGVPGEWRLYAVARPA